MGRGRRVSMRVKGAVNGAVNGAEGKVIPILHVHQHLSGKVRIAGPDTDSGTHHRTYIDQTTHGQRATSPASATTLNSTAIGVGSAPISKVVRVACMGSKTSL